jgi:inositol-phosphate transport system substrate-binding protein
MKKTHIMMVLLLFASLISFSAPQQEAAKEPMVIEALTIGPGPVPVTRAQNLETAAEELKREGTELDFEVTFSTQKFGPYRTSFSLAYSSGSAPDILSEDQDIIPEYAEEGMIIPIDKYVKAGDWQANYQDFLPGLWDAVSWKGKIYGVPIEGVVNCIFYRKDVLRKMGLSDAEIARTFSPGSRDFTLDALVALAKKAKQAGLVEWGFTHRKGAGDYWFNSVVMFGGEFVDKATGNMVIDTQALRKDFEFHKMLVDEGLTPPDMASWDWKVIHKYTVEGRTLFWIGGHSGQWKEYQDKEYHEQLGKLTEEYLQKNMGIAPFPGLNGPVTPVKVHAYTIVSTTENPDFCFDLISRATTPELLSLHAITTFRGPTRRSVAEQSDFKAQKYLSQVLEIMKYSQAFPKHPALGTYKSMIFEAMSGIETGRLTVDKAIDFMVAKAKSDIPEVIIR